MEKKNNGTSGTSTSPEESSVSSESITTQETLIQEPGRIMDHISHSLSLPSLASVGQAANALTVLPHQIASASKLLGISPVSSESTPAQETLIQAPGRIVDHISRSVSLPSLASVAQAAKVLTALPHQIASTSKLLGIPGLMPIGNAVPSSPDSSTPTSVTSDSSSSTESAAKLPSVARATQTRPVPKRSYSVPWHYVYV